MFHPTVKHEDNVRNVLSIEGLNEISLEITTTIIHVVCFSKLEAFLELEDTNRNQERRSSGLDKTVWICTLPVIACHPFHHHCALNTLQKPALMSSITLANAAQINKLVEFPMSVSCVHVIVRGAGIELWLRKQE